MSAALSLVHRRIQGEQRFLVASRADRRFDCAVVWNVMPPKPCGAVVSLVKRLVGKIGGEA